MTAIRVIFDGRAFTAQQPAALAAQSEALVVVEENDLAARRQLDEAVRACYAECGDAEDADWEKLQRRSHIAPGMNGRNVDGTGC